MSTAKTIREVRIRVPLNPEDEQDIDAEYVAAEQIAPEEFRILHSPFFAFDLSANDVVSAEKAGEDFEFRSLLTRGGHSTYRVYLENNRAIHDDDVQAAWAPIAALGITCERAANSFFTIDIPPGKDIAAIYDLLEQGEAAGIWEFEESHYEPSEDTDSATDDSQL